MTEAHFAGLEAMRRRRPLLLHQEVELMTGTTKRCPCCWRPMTKSYRLNGHKCYGTDRSRGHVYSAPFAPGHRDVWFSMCRDCNAAQGADELLQWAHKLVHFRDPRAAYVVKLCRIVYEWLDARGRRVERANPMPELNTHAAS